MTDNEIIKALECFAIDKDFDETHCIGCAFEHQFCTANMSVDIAMLALGLINRQKAEIEALIAGQETLQKHIAEQKAEIERLEKEVTALMNDNNIKSANLEWVQKLMSATDKVITEAKAEAIKEFAKKIKADAEWICDDYYIEDTLTEYVDDLVKEMVGEK